MHQVPGLFGLNHIGEGSHLRAVQTGHKDAVQLLIGSAALGAVGARKVVWPNRLVVAIGQGRSGWTITTAFLSVALPAFELLEEFAAVLDALDGQLRFSRDGNRVARLLGFEARRKRLD